MDHHINVMHRGLTAAPSKMSEAAGRYSPGFGYGLVCSSSLITGPLWPLVVLFYEIFTDINQQAKEEEFINVLPALLKQLHLLSENPDGSNKVVRVQFKKGDQVETITITQKEDGCEISSDWLDGESRMLYGVTLETLRHEIAKEIFMRPDVYGLENANMPEVRATLLKDDEFKIAVEERQYSMAANVARRLAETLGDVLPTLLMNLYSSSETPSGTNNAVHVQFKNGGQVENVTLTQKEDGCEISSDWLDGKSLMLYGVTLETLRYEIAKEISKRRDFYGLENAKMLQVRATLLEHKLKIAVEERQYSEAANVARRLANTLGAVDKLRADRYLENAAAYDEAATKAQREPGVKGKLPKSPHDHYPVVTLPPSAVLA